MPTFLPILALFLIFLLFTGYSWLFRGYAGISQKGAILAFAVSALASAAVAYQRMNALELSGRFGGHHSVSEKEVYFGVAAAALAICLLCAFALRLWGRWVADKATAEERLPGLPGVHAWFSTMNVLVGVSLVGTLWYGFDIPPLLSTIAVTAALAAAPLLRMESPAPVKASAVADDLSPEREKILSMLESGKLTPDESTELLQALQQSPPAAPRPVPMTSSQRLILIGAAVVGLGFLMPWVVINPGKEAGRMMEQLQGSMNSTLGTSMSFPAGMGISSQGISSPTISVGGGDIPRGLGWVALGLALTAALLPYLAVNVDTATSRTVRMLCLGVGGFIILYLITSYFRFVGMGLMMAFCGYLLESIGVFREAKAAA